MVHVLLLCFMFKIVLQYLDKTKSMYMYCRPQYDVGITEPVLKNWFHWAKEQNKDDVVLDLAHGPAGMETLQWDRGNLAGASFTRSTLESKIKAKNSIIMISDATTSSKFSFGRVKRFLTVQHGTWLYPLKLVDAMWFNDNKMNKAIRCPIIKKSFTHPKSQFWYAGSIKPVKLALLPHYDEKTQKEDQSNWQVIPLSSDYW